MKQLTPRQIVKELDKYIIGQDKAKRAVAVALQNRLRRLRLTDMMREEVRPKNLLMIGPTGVGKTEIARRLANIAGAPFIKVEATKYTEVGYVGRDVESMVRDLVENSISLVKKEKHALVQDEAYDQAVQRIAAALKPGKKKKKAQTEPSQFFQQMFGGQLSEEEQMEQMSELFTPQAEEEEEIVDDSLKASRRQLRQLIRDGKLDDEEVTIKLEEKEIHMSGMNPAMEQMMDLQDSLNALRPKKMIKRTVTVKEALKLVTEEEADKLVDLEDIQQIALERAEQNGIIFIDEIDKIAAGDQQQAGVSREGVQRDILPIVEGSQIQTKYGIINTDHILFVGSGAFHVSKPSDLIPELQGRFPLRVNLEDLTQEDFVRILTEPENALIKQYQALLATDGVDVTFTDSAIQAMAAYAVELNDSTDNIGARRLHTILETVLEELLFEAADMAMGSIEITEQYAQERLDPIVENRDLSHYIL